MDNEIKAFLIVMGIGFVGFVLWPSDDDAPVLMTGSGVLNSDKPMEEMFDKAGARTEGDFQQPKEPAWGKTPP